MRSRIVLPFLVKFLTLSLALATPAFALDEIITPYLSVRSVGMGGVIMTTGLYDENFFNNPARVTANPDSKFTLLKISAATTNKTTNTISSFSNGGGSDNALNSISNATGSNLYGRVQMVLPALYIASDEDRKWALAIGVTMGFQVDAILRQSYQMNLLGIADVGPAMTLGRKFLKDDALSVGVTGRLGYRFATDPNFSLLSYVSGTPLSGSSLAGAGMQINGDVGATYNLAKLGEFNIDIGGAIQNIMGGKYKNSPLQNGQLPSPQPRSYGLGTSISRPSFGPFTRSVFALELTNVLNNQNGSFFRMVHMGGETRWKFLALRVGANQGYLTAGLGIDLRFLTLDFATYGEELGLNAGTMEDRRYAVSVGIHI